MASRAVLSAVKRSVGSVTTPHGFGAGPEGGGAVGGLVGRRTSQTMGGGGLAGVALAALRAQVRGLRICDVM